METEGGSQLFETQKREGGEDRSEVCQQKKKEVLYLVKKKKDKNNGSLWI